MPSKDNGLQIHADAGGLLKCPVAVSHLWDSRVRRAPGPLTPGAALTAELLAAVLLHPLQQQVVDGREVVVAAALERLQQVGSK